MEVCSAYFKDRSYIECTPMIIAFCRSCTVIIVSLFFFFLSLDDFKTKELERIPKGPYNKMARGEKVVYLSMACSCERVVWLHYAIRGHLVSDGSPASGTIYLNRPLILNSNRGLHHSLVMQEALLSFSWKEALTAWPLIAGLFFHCRSPSCCNLVWIIVISNKKEAKC